MELYFNDDQMKQALTKLGYSFKEETRNYGFPIYHNDVNFIDMEVLVVYNPDGTSYDKDYSWKYGDKNDQLKKVFRKELTNLLLKLF